MRFGDCISMLFLLFIRPINFQMCSVMMMMFVVALYFRVSKNSILKVQLSSFLNIRQQCLVSSILELEDDILTNSVWEFVLFYFI